VNFKKGEVYAQTGVVGACAKIDSDLICSVSAQRLEKAIKAVGKESTIERTGDLLLLRSENTEREAKVPIVSAASPPLMHGPTKKARWHETATLAHAEALFWTCSMDTSRTYMSGVNLGAPGMMATNGQSAVLYRGENFVEVFKENRSVSVPIPFLKGLGENVLVALEKGRIFCKEQGSDTYRSGALIGGEFPPLMRVIDDALTGERAVVNRTALISMLKRGRLSGPTVMLEIGTESLSLVVEHSEANNQLFDFGDRIPFVESEAQPFTVGFDAGKLIDVLSHASADEVTLKLGGPFGPLAVEDENYVVVVMPVRMPS